MEKSPLSRLMETIPQKGKVEWIGLRPASKAPMQIVESVEAKLGEGLMGDRFKGKFSTKRQVTLIQQEHIDAVRSILKDSAINPDLIRRNIVVSGINLMSLKGKEFRIGGAIFEATGECHPCSRMEKNLGEGGYNAMRGHGGITAKVIGDGEINLGDEVYFEGDS
ncbi:MAG: MOSC domain-containing protein [Cyclobacteriaceae bacterium]